MNYRIGFIYSLLLIATPTIAHQHAPAECGAEATPLLSVADFDADGIVTGKDIKDLVNHKNSGTYYALYDRNADGVLDAHDVHTATKDMKRESTEMDRKLAKLYQQAKALQTASGAEQLTALGFTQITGALAGHGVHWTNTSSDLPIAGINVLEDGSAVKAVYFGNDALPLFNDSSAETGISTLDYPSFPGAWMYERVQAFGSPPPAEPNVDLKLWHTHAGLCITMQDLGTGPKFVLDQHTSFMECQVIPSLVQVEYGDQLVNAWFNIWMLHGWIFDLNPAGVFAGTHPCVDQHAPLESEINGDREVPPFFQHQ